MKNSFEIIFVYNANSGFLASVKDTVHKAVSPNTYSCNLCKITYGAFSMKEDWKEFLKTIKTKVTFLHKDEFNSKYPSAGKIELPAVFIKHEEKIEEIISAREINVQKSISGLSRLVVEKLIL